MKSQLKEAIGDVEGVEVQVEAKVGLGSQYRTINDVLPLDKEEKVSIEQNGEVLLIDFWATWCPPCQ